MIRRQLYALFIALDLLLAALTGGAPWQTLSARFWKAEQRGSVWGARFRRGTDWVATHAFREPNHCRKSWENYVARLKAVQ